MQRRLLLLLVCLLALRGWVGEAMAGEMLRQHLAAAPGMPAAHAMAQPGASSDDCRDGIGHASQPAMQHGEHHATGTAGPAAGASAADDCPTCASCQVCSSVGLGVAVATLPAGAFSQAPPATVPARHPSAERVPAYKPPIS